MKIKGNTFLVTGGSSGLGEACVRRLVAGGANVVIADVNSEAGNELAEELGENAYFVYTDVRERPGHGRHSRRDLWRFAGRD